jgi:hypothetical protein
MPGMVGNLGGETWMEDNIQMHFDKLELAGCGIEPSGQFCNCGRPRNMVDGIFVPLKAEELLGFQERVLCGVTPP